MQDSGVFSRCIARRGLRGADMKYVSMGHVPVYVGICTSPKAYLKEMKRLGVQNPGVFIPEGKDAAVHYFCREGKTTVIVAFKPPSKVGCTKAQIAALAAHEAVHVMQECESVMGDTMSRESSAYLVQWITQNILMELWGALI